MRVSSTELFPCPGYEDHVQMTLRTDAGGTLGTADLQKVIRAFTLEEGDTMEDLLIPGTRSGQTLKLRIFRSAGVLENAPVILDVHGGGFIKGSLDIDCQRCITLARLTGCILASVEYRLTDETVRFPEPLLDCRTAYLWMREHAAELGGDPDRIGLHGTSAGGCLCAGLALYLRDEGAPAPSLTVLNCPVIDNERTFSMVQFGNLGGWNVPYRELGFVQYAGLNSGDSPSCYAVPGRCRDLRGLGPHAVITAEYDPLRDEGLRYAMRLLECGVPCEIMTVPRVTHGFCAVDHPLSRMVHRGIAFSFRREFGLDNTEI